MEAIAHHPFLGTLTVIWLFLAILTGLVAGEKNRRFWPWVLLGLLLGPFALFWVFTTHRVIPREEARPCPHCDGTISITASKCHHCGKVVAAEKLDTAAKLGREAAGAVFIFRHALRRQKGAPPPRPRAAPQSRDQQASE
jgi:hypothetical protein